MEAGEDYRDKGGKYRLPLELKSVKIEVFKEATMWESTPQTDSYWDERICLRGFMFETCGK